MINWLIEFKPIRNNGQKSIYPCIHPYCNSSLPAVCLSVCRPVPPIGVFRGSESCRRFIRLRGREIGPLQDLFLPRTTQKHTQTHIPLLQSRFPSCRRLRALDRAVTEGESIVFYRITWILTYYIACGVCESQQVLHECHVICISSWIQFWFLVSFQRIRSMSRLLMIYEVLWLVHFRGETWTNSRALSHSPILSVSVLALQALKMCGL
jgi:hypothetical protein